MESGGKAGNKGQQKIWIRFVLPPEPCPSWFPTPSLDLSQPSTCSFPSFLPLQMVSPTNFLLSHVQQSLVEILIAPFPLSPANMTDGKTVTALAWSPTSLGVFFKAPQVLQGKAVQSMEDLLLEDFSWRSCSWDWDAARPPQPYQELSSWTSLPFWFKNLFFSFPHPNFPSLLRLSLVRINIRFCCWFDICNLQAQLTKSAQWGVSVLLSLPTTVLSPLPFPLFPLHPLNKIFKTSHQIQSPQRKT